MLGLQIPNNPPFLHHVKANTAQVPKATGTVLLVIAEPEARYEAWLRNEADTARAPTTAQAAQGKQVFLQGPCALCHAIRGTDAAATNGPDLTHLARRRTIAAATLPNNIGALGAWIIDPHAPKPGNNMPGSALSPQDLQTLLAYLVGLK